jgi:hypothetical protein
MRKPCSQCKAIYGEEDPADTKACQIVVLNPKEEKASRRTLFTYTVEKEDEMVDTQSCRVMIFDPENPNFAKKPVFSFEFDDEDDVDWKKVWPRFKKALDKKLAAIKKEGEGNKEK